jgi:hypothetical protein
MDMSAHGVSEGTLNDQIEQHCSKNPSTLPNCLLGFEHLQTNTGYNVIHHHVCCIESTCSKHLVTIFIQEAILRSFPRLRLCAMFCPREVNVFTFGHRPSLAIEQMYDRSREARMYGHSHEARMYGHSHEARMYGHSHEARMYDRSLEAHMYGHSHEARMYDRSHEACMYGHSDTNQL